jgi:hypothetical protein
MIRVLRVVMYIFTIGWKTIHKRALTLRLYNFRFWIIQKFQIWNYIYNGLSILKYVSPMYPKCFCKVAINYILIYWTYEYYLFQWSIKVSSLYNHMF